MRDKTPDYIFERALMAKENADRLIKQSKNSIPELYHDFIVSLNETKRLSEEMIYVDDRTYKLGVWNKEGTGTLQTLPKPYLTVDGRVLWARNEHKEAGRLLNIHEPTLSKDGSTMTVVVDSEMLGKSAGMIEIKNHGKGVGKDNPFAVAQTSALGRALGFLGYGLIGTGISAEEIHQDSQEHPTAATPTSESNDNEPIEVTVIAISEPNINEQHASFKGTIGKDDYTVTIPISKSKEINRIKIGYNVTGFVWFDGPNIRFSSDNAIHVVNAVKRYELTLGSSPKFSDDGSSIFQAKKGNEEIIVKAPSALKSEIEHLLKGQIIKVDGLFIKGLIRLPAKNTIELLTKKAG